MELVNPVDLNQLCHAFANSDIDYLRNYYAIHGPYHLSLQYSLIIRAVVQSNVTIVQFLIDVVKYTHIDHIIETLMSHENYCPNCMEIFDYLFPQIQDLPGILDYLIFLLRSHTLSLVYQAVKIAINRYPHLFRENDTWIYFIRHIESLIRVYPHDVSFKYQLIDTYKAIQQTQPFPLIHQLISAAVNPNILGYILIKGFDPNILDTNHFTPINYMGVKHHVPGVSDALLVEYHNILLSHPQIDLSIRGKDNFISPRVKQELNKRQVIRKLIKVTEGSFTNYLGLLPLEVKKIIERYAISSLG